MYSKTFLLVALVLVLAMGMGCGGGSDTISGGDTSSPIIGTWNRADSNVTFPQQIVFNANGTGTYIFANSIQFKHYLGRIGEPGNCLHGICPDRLYYSEWQ